MRAGTERQRSFELLANLVTGRPVHVNVDWRSEALWHRLLPMAELHRVTAFLPGAIQSIGEWEKVPVEIANFLKAVKELNLERNQSLGKQCLKVLDILEKEAIPALPLKGLAYDFIGLHAGDPGKRMTIDIDVLVPMHAADKAQELLILDGYAPIAEHGISKRDQHNLPRLKPDPDVHGPGSIEVHFRVGRNEADVLLPAQKFLDAAETVLVSNRHVRVPNIVDLVDHAVIHSGISHSYAIRRTLRLRDVVDICRLWEIAQSRGVEPADLRISDHKLAGRYFGACLLLHGHPFETLGPLGQPSAELLEQIMRRQFIAERSNFESAIVSNLRLLVQDPASLASKLLSRRFYRNARRFAKSAHV